MSVALMMRRFCRCSGALTPPGSPLRRPARRRRRSAASARATLRTPTAGMCSAVALIICDSGAVDDDLLAFAQLVAIGVEHARVADDEEAVQLGTQRRGPVGFEGEAHRAADLERRRQQQHGRARPRRLHDAPRVVRAFEVAEDDLLAAHDHAARRHRADGRRGRAAAASPRAAPAARRARGCSGARAAGRGRGCRSDCRPRRTCSSPSPSVHRLRVVAVRSCALRWYERVPAPRVRHYDRVGRHASHRGDAAIAAAESPDTQHAVCRRGARRRAAFSRQRQ